MALLNISVATPDLSLLVRGDQRVTVYSKCPQLSQDWTVVTSPVTDCGSDFARIDRSL